MLNALQTKNNHTRVPEYILVFGINTVLLTKTNWGFVIFLGVKLSVTFHIHTKHSDAIRLP